MIRRPAGRAIGVLGVAIFVLWSVVWGARLMPGRRALAGRPASAMATPPSLVLLATPSPTLTPTHQPPTPSVTPGTTSPPIWDAMPLASRAISATATATPSATPGPTPDGAMRTARVPIIMYHYISEPPVGADIYRQDLSVAPERFESHLRYLKEAGYTTVSLDDLLYYLSRGRPLPGKPVILTFDDGYRDQYESAYPLLRKYGMIGHFFLITDFINMGRPKYLSWSQVEEMSAQGQLFGSHSRDHPDLSARRPVDYLTWQALGGLESIQEHLGYHARWISYPSGSYDKQSIAVYRSANYWGGLTTRQGVTNQTDDLFTLRRVRVRGSYAAEDLAMLLRLDW